MGIKKHIKRFARWMYMQAHRDEIKQAMSYGAAHDTLRADPGNPRRSRDAGRAEGVLRTMVTLDLLH